MVIFFDIDDTLTDSESAHIYSINQLCQEYCLCSTTDSKDIAQNWIKITNKYLKLFFDGKISLEQQRSNRIKEFWQLNGFKISTHEANKVYLKYHQLFLLSCKTFPDVVPTLERLGSKHQLGIISNGVYSDQIFKLKQNNLYYFFDEIIISENIDRSKPDKEIFIYAAKKMGVSPSHSLHIGDSYKLDYLGGKKAGMNTILLDRKNTSNNFGCKKIHSLFELENFI